jgi:hypothetical protein
MKQPVIFGYCEVCADNEKMANVRGVCQGCGTDEIISFEDNWYSDDYSKSGCTHVRFTTSCTSTQVYLLMIF